ncbi:6393_t:CDS:2 [Cetraspora pellucida]|uniref:6393_t:CDS:1 n=1 Tax=Cetraspora pellucida TaxID=1433469 RepID=A0ACA9KST7_9GLOM|nr:6393_t:CDS:2 [Cetraspora pellucida]
MLYTRVFCFVHYNPENDQAILKQLYKCEHLQNILENYEITTDQF